MFCSLTNVNSIDCGFKLHMVSNRGDLPDIYTHAYALRPLPIHRNTMECVVKINFALVFFSKLSTYKTILGLIM